MEIINEIIEYVGSRDARFAIYGSILSILVIYLIRKGLVILAAWKTAVAQNGKRGFNNFLIWLGHHYKSCPSWLKVCARGLEKILKIFGIKRPHSSRYRRKRK